MDKYDKEVQERWGSTDAFKQSQSKSSKYSKEDFEAAKANRKGLPNGNPFCRWHGAPADAY